MEEDGIQKLQKLPSSINILKSMLKKQKTATLALLTTFLIGMAQAQLGTQLFPPPTTDCAAVTCLIGNICIQGRCIPRDDSPPEYPTVDPCFPEVSSPVGCILSCQDPQFENCEGMIFPAIFDPMFCGWNPVEQTWGDYTFSCQACLAFDVVGILDRKCTCEQLGCNAGETCNIGTGQCDINPSGCKDCKDYEFCSNGRCEDRCNLIDCFENNICIQGQCVPFQMAPPQKCSTTLPARVECVIRPTLEECPVIINVRAPDLVICGIDKKGNKQGFARICEACLDKNIASYYETECENVPETLCKDYEFCDNGECRDKCAFIKCSSGHICEKAVCIPTDPCLGVRCPPTFVCELGDCVPEKLDPCALVLCPANSFCENGDCIPIDACAAIRCNSGYVCQDGGCIPTDECYGQCQDYERCFKGECRDKCQFLKCANCYKGQCGVIQKPECDRDWHCEWNEKCYNGKCVNDCFNVQCGNHQQCRYGRCIPVYRSIYGNY